jgi:hypothetical protein
MLIGIDWGGTKIEGIAMESLRRSRVRSYLRPSFCGVYAAHSADGYWARISSQAH